MKEEGIRISQFLIDVNPLCYLKPDSSKFRISNMRFLRSVSQHVTGFIDLMLLRTGNKNYSDRLGHNAINLKDRIVNRGN
jgi:hypothetical protein